MDVSSWSCYNEERKELIKESKELVVPENFYEGIAE